VNRQDEAIRGALGALRPEDEHPGHELLEAYVEGRLTPEQRAEIDQLAARSQVVAEDLADLQTVNDALRLEPSRLHRGGSRSVQLRWGRGAALAALAASVVFAVWIFNQGVQAPTRVVSTDEAERVRLAVTSGRVTLPAQIVSLRPVEGTLLGAAQPAAFRLQTPVGTAVPSQRPLFTWDDARAEAYTVAVFDQSFSEVARGRTNSTSWQPDVDLRRGGTYSWQVTAHRGSEDITEPKPPRPEARFTIVDAATADRIAEMQTRLANEPLTLGVLLAESGLIDEARVQLSRASRLPESRAVAARLLESLDQGTPITTKPAQ